MNLFQNQDLYPKEEEIIINHFKNYFESCYIALLPFFKLRNINKSSNNYKKSRLISYEELQQEVEEIKNIPIPEALIFSYDNPDYPNEKEIIENGQEISWEWIIKNSKLNDIRDIYKALGTSIGAFKTKYARPELAEILMTFTNTNQIWHPVEGMYDTISKIKIYNALKKLGISKIIVSDEFYDNSKEINLLKISISDFINKIKEKDYYIYSKEKSILFTIGWDSFFYIICSTEKNIKIITNSESIEGFFANESTTENWIFDFEKY